MSILITEVNHYVCPNIEGTEFKMIVEINHFQENCRIGK